jgi:outer membrane murein-binding lipoprotein Lpp
VRAIPGANLALVLAFGYGLYSMKSTLADRIAAVESTTQQVQSKTEKKVTDLSSDVELINQRVGVTSTELNHARETAQALKRDQEKAARELSSQLATKASSTDVDVLRQESTNKMAELQQDSNTKIGTVSGEVTGIKQELVSTREDWGRQLVDVKNVLSEGIARNSSELSQLRKKGERDYIEFDIRKSSKQAFQRVGDVQLALLNTDTKKSKYSIAVKVDDNRLEKKDRTANEPVQFLVGRDELRYEVVVNSVEKDRIRGYVSVPKDKVLSAEHQRLQLP